MISIDCETTGLEETDYPFCFTISDETNDYYFDSSCSASRSLIRDADHLYLTNAKFDARMLAHMGINIFDKKVYDTAVMARIVRNDHMQYSLDAQAKRYGMEKDKEVEKNIKANKLYETRRDYFGRDYKVPRYDRVDRELLKKYALKDARLTYDLAKKYLEAMDHADRSVLEMESLLTPVCYRMERHGIMLNHQYTLQGYHHETGILNRLKDQFKEVSGAEYVNSAKSLSKTLRVQLPETESGNPSLTDDVIEMLKPKIDAQSKDAAILGLIQQIRYYDKRISTYYDPYLVVQDGRGIIHPHMWQAGTRTGRFSYSDPNLQNIPKEEDSVEPFVIRGCFRPRPGYRFVSMDYSQQEYALMADYANEAEVIKKFNAGGDFHQVTADMFGVSRKYAKTLNFAVLYGAGPAKIAGMLGITEVEARRLVNKYFMALPRVERLINDIVATGRGRGYINNWNGRKLYAQKEFCYALPNHLIQGGAADIVKRAMIDIDKYIEGKDIYMVLQIHDQIVFEVPLGMDDTHVIEIKRIMENTYRSMSGVQMRVDVSTSNSSLAERDMVKYGNP